MILVLAALAAAALGVASASSALTDPSAARPPLLLQTLATGDTVRVEPWGANALRVRVALAGAALREDAPGALIPPGSDNKGWPPAASTISTAARNGGGPRRISSGNIAAEISAAGLVTVRRLSDGLVLLREAARGGATPTHYPRSNLTVPAVYEAFDASDPSERVFGFGEHQRSEIDLTNQTFDMEAAL
jgi:alpha-D-xyloside xylohydrolase